jgi:hypothetical protein
MGHRLSSDRPISLSMPSLNVNSLLNLLVNRSHQGLPCKCALKSAFLSVAAGRRRASLRAVSALWECGSPVFDPSREDDARILNHVSIHVATRALRRIGSARVRSARPRTGDTACFKPSPLAPVAESFRGASLGYGSIFTLPRCIELKTCKTSSHRGRRRSGRCGHA